MTRRLIANDPEIAILHREAHRQGRFVSDLPLFALVRRTDPPTSTLAAESVADRLSELQTAVLDAFRRHGPMTAKQAEQLPEFRHLGPSTVRKRICECARLGELETTGAIVDRCAEYRVREEAT